MAFIDPKRDQEDDEDLPGASGLHLELDLKRCPVCKREVNPWQTTCPDCGETAVAASAVPASDFALPPGLLDLDDDEGETDDPSRDEAGGAADR